MSRNLAVPKQQIVKAKQRLTLIGCVIPIWYPRGNAFDINSLYSMSFDGCEFGNGMKFKVTYGTMNTGTIDFTDCKYNGQSMDNLELLNQIIVGQVIISINGVPKYSTTYDTEAPTKWKVTAIE